MLAIAAHKGLAAYALGASIVESGVSVYMGKHTGAGRKSTRVIVAYARMQL
jgi:hypothetical protein